MKLSFSRLALLCVLGTATLVSCDPDGETPAPAGKTAQLTATPWRITAWTRTTGSSAAVDYIPTVYPNSCQRDDRYAFETNGTLIRREGPTWCSTASNSQTIISTSPWNFNTAQTQLTIGSANMGTTSITYDVVRLTDDLMDLRYTRTSNGQTVVDNINYRN